jgi:ABC-type lipoprotein release transport system permease subunit
MRLYAMAWRNLWRNRRRTLITLSALVFGMFLVIIGRSFSDRNLGDAVDLAARLGSGHVTLQHPEYLDAPSTRRTVVNTSELERRARAERGVKGAVHRVVGQLMLATASQSQGAQFIAYDPRRDDTHTLPLLDSVPESGRLREPIGQGIILGAKLAENLDAGLGKKVVYTMTDRRGEIVTGLGRVSGILKTGAQGLDANLCLLPIDTVRQMLGYGADESTFVAVFVADHRKSKEVAARLQRELGREVAALPWTQVQPEMAAFVATKSGGQTVLAFIMLLLTGAGIFNTLFVSVMERLREFGIMMAIGFSPGRLFRLVIWESVWLGLVGVVAGLAVVAFPYYMLATRGLDYSKMSGGKPLELGSIAMAPRMYGGIHPENAVLIIVVVLLATLLSGLYPAWRAARVEPVEAIKLV